MQKKEREGCETLQAAQRRLAFALGFRGGLPGEVGVDVVGAVCGRVVCMVPWWGTTPRRQGKGEVTREYGLACS